MPQRPPRGDGETPPQKPWTTPRLLAEVINLAEDAIISAGADQRIVLFNQGAERVFGYAAAEVIGKPLDILLPERMAEAHRRQMADFAKSPLSARPMRERNPIRGRRKDGSEFPAEASISKVNAGGQMTLTVILRDISERVAADHKLQDSLREKEALLREIHHRVKNNLQVMSSLLGLQSRATANEDARKAFEDSQNRIHSMALLHDMLCRAGNFSRIDLADYTRQLATHLFQSYGAVSRRVRLDASLSPIHLSLEGAVPYGLIVNELLANALEHAFPGGRSGVIGIELRELADQGILLAVRDNGVGLPGEVDWLTGASLGFRLVRTLAEQLGAKIEVNPRNPTEVRITFQAR
ncbi:MAG TPA: histidine kinase dimerization/phosphoacceptor domain -containing protein [Bryobacteraceae bacterium]|nr:histidine kinase dimerization/phosphoacceptor domain -containing protein [Bryobacteraceae bacterium]